MKAVAVILLGLLGLSACRHQPAIIRQGCFAQHVACVGAP